MAFDPDQVTNSLSVWVDHYLSLTIIGVRSAAVARKITLHLERFQAFFKQAYGHDRISTCLKRDVLAWRESLQAQNLAPATINNHLASLSTFTTWVQAQAQDLFPAGDPAKGIGELPLPPLEPRALTDDQVRSLKNLCDRLDHFYRLKGRRQNKRGTIAPLRANARPLRDRAIVFSLLATGLRREELIRLNLGQLQPNTPQALRSARRARVDRVQGKGQTERIVFLSADARVALADYLEYEYPQDSTIAVSDNPAQPLFLSAAGVASRAADGRLSPRAVNHILTQIGRWHDAELDNPERHISPLRPHDLRHTFAFRLARTTGADPYELERRLGHRSQRYIQRYTNPPEHIAANYIEQF
jgi:integrase